MSGNVRFGTNFVDFVGREPRIIVEIDDAAHRIDEEKVHDARGVFPRARLLHFAPRLACSRQQLAEASIPDFYFE